MIELFNNKKALMIVGPECSGKTLLAKLIAKAIGNEVWMDAIDFKIPGISYKAHILLYEACDSETKLVIVDDCDQEFSYEIFYSAIWHGVSVSGETPGGVEIYPNFIFTSCYHPVIMQDWWVHNCEVIDVEKYKDFVFDKRVLAWHKADTDLALHEFLGVSVEEIKKLITV
jgi:hypothetical protein